MTCTCDFTGTRTLDIAGEAIVEGTMFADRYAVEGRLGAGAQATVYAALDMHASPPRRVALKVARANVFDKANLAREADLLAHLHAHGNVAGVVRLVEPYVCEVSGIEYLVLEHIEGPRLRDKVLPLADVCRVGSHLARTLAVMHKSNVVFADVKPENILLRDGIEPVFIDFGAARKLDDVDAPGLLTPAYAAPEQHAGQLPTPASDIYSLALVLEECAGPRPPRQWSVLLARAKTKNPAARPSAGAFSQMLDEARLLRAKRHSRAPLLALTTLVIGLAGLTMHVLSRDASVKHPPNPPFTLISASGKVQYVAADAAHVYWSDGDGRTIFRAPLDGGPFEVVTQLETPAHQVAIAGQTIFVRSPDAIWALAENQLTRFAESTGRGGIVADDQHVAWTNEDTGDVVLASVHRDIPRRVLAAGQARPYSITMDSTHVVWANEANGKLVRVLRTGGDPEVLVQGQSFPVSPVLDATHLYWVDRAAGRILRIPKDGGTPETLTKISLGSWALALQGMHVIWTSSGDGRVMRIPKTGGSAEVLAAGQPNPLNLAVRGNVLFFSNYTGGGGVMRLEVP